MDVKKILNAITQNIEWVDKEYLETQFTNFFTRMKLLFASKSEIPKNVSELNNDKNYISNIPVASVGNVGGVKPDGVTTEVEDDGTLKVIGGTGSGVSDYEKLENLPSINSKRLIGNLSLEELGIQPYGNYLQDEDLEDYSTKEETGYSLGLEMDPETFVITLSLKTKDGQELSSKQIDLPLESAVIGIKVNKEEQTITLILQNGSETEPIPFSDLLVGIVSQDFTIAGIDMKDDITKEELQAALDVPTNVSDLNDAENYLKVSDKATENIDFSSFTI